MITAQKLLSFGEEKLVRLILSLYEQDDAWRKQIEIRVAALEENPGQLISLIKKEISSLKKSSRFIEYHESDDFTDRLDQVRAMITDRLTSQSPEHALRLLLDFLDLNSKTLGRVDDSNGTISGVFVQACHDLGDLYQKVTISLEEVVNTVFERFMNNDFGIYDSLITSCHQKLGEQGLLSLRERFQKTDVTKQNTYTIQGGLCAIADGLNDVEAYIQACGSSAENHALDIAKRWIEQGKGEEALRWLDKKETSTSHCWDQNIFYPLKIKALELCHLFEQAQDTHIEWFDRTFSASVYREILKNISLDHTESFEKATLEKVFQSAHPEQGLAFLLETKQFEALARFVFLRLSSLDGHHYYGLRSAAEALKEMNPLASILLYRKLLEAVLQKAQSKYYPYAVKDLIKCDLLQEKVTDWEEHMNPSDYHDMLIMQHKKKVSFWTQYEQQIQKQKAKEMKSTRQAGYVV